MRYLLIILSFLLFSSALAQNGHRIHRYKFYDTTVVEDYQKTHRKRLTIDIDSTGIAMYAWGDECYMKINLLQRMLINANFYESGTHRGRPYLKYGNNRLRFRMYVNRSGNFEFDAIVRSKLPNGRHEIPFNIESKNLRFLFQPELTQREIDDECERPDSVINSYAVYHSSKQGNLIYPDGREVNYRTGKAFHIYRPKAWDNAGDTVWAYIEIDTITNRMVIGVDSTWMANAVYPVTIDPNWGDESHGASNQSMGHFIRANFFENSPSDAAGGALISVTFHQVTLTAADNSLIIWALYSDNGSDDPDSRLTFQSTGEALLAANDDTDILCDNSFSAFSLGGSTKYHFVNMSDIATSSELRSSYDVDNGGPQENSSAAQDEDQYPNFPATATGFNFNNNRAVSVYGTYTVSGGADPSTRRRKVILGGN